MLISCRIAGAASCFAKRYTAALLKSKTDASSQLIVISYHGKYKNPGAKPNEAVTSDDEDAPHMDAEQERRDVTARNNAKEFIKLVADTACRLRTPAVIGGDWNAPLMDRWLPRKDNWELRLR